MKTGEIVNDFLLTDHAVVVSKLILSRDVEREG